MTRYVLPLVLLLSGCADDLLTPAASPPESRATASHLDVPKLRSAHLAALDDDESPRYITLFNDPATVEATRFVGRYTFLENSRFVGRYNGQTGQIDTLGVSSELNLVVFRNEYCDDDDDCDDDDTLEAALAVLAADDDVASLEPDIPVTTPLAFATKRYPTTQQTPWGITRIGANQVEVPLAAQAQVDLYVFDTAVGTTDLNVAERLNFSTDTAPSSHGYHVAGTAAALNNGQGVVGVAPGVTLRSVNVLDAFGQAELSTVIIALETVRARKLQQPSRPVVVSMSLGANTNDTALNALDASVQAAVAAGVVVVIAAGNEGIDASFVTPARVPEALTVGAYDTKGRFASFSNRGPLVDVLAPGVNVLSLAIDARGRVAVAQSSGTSMAAPHVAGAAALLLAQYPAWTPAQVAQWIVQNSQGGVKQVPAGTTNRTVYVASL